MNSIRTKLITALSLLLLITMIGCSRNSAENTAPAATSATADQTTAEQNSKPNEDTGATVDEKEKSEESAQSSATPTPLDEENTIITSEGLQYTEHEAGTGTKPEKGDIVAVHYKGALTDGTEFDNSHKRGEPFRFPLGTGAVIAGWDEGISMMAEGGKATLVIPPELGYGDAGAGGVIPPNATLVFEVELVEVLEGAPEAPVEVTEEDYQTTEEGLKYYDHVIGEGPQPESGQQVVVHYTGWLEDGTKFDSSLDRGEPLTFNIGSGQVIRGWDIGLSTMKTGGKRQLVIPSDLGYGDKGAGGVIPPKATLIFEVELLEIR